MAISSSRVRSRRIALSVRLGLCAVVFIFMVGVAADTLDHAVRHAGYLKTYSNGDYFRSGPPSLNDAVWVCFWGPVSQIVVFSSLTALVSRKRHEWTARLGTVSWIMLALDLIFVIIVLTLVAASIAV